MEKKEHEVEIEKGEEVKRGKGERKGKKRGFVSYPMSENTSVSA